MSNDIQQKMRDGEIKSLLTVGAARNYNTKFEKTRIYKNNASTNCFVR